MKTISAFDKAAFNTKNPEGQAPYLFVCEHASNYIPKEFNNLGLASELLNEHIAWDPGTADLTQYLADSFNSCSVLCEYSRLLIDCNRPIGDKSSILEVSEHHAIPGNKQLSDEHKQARAEAIFKPFHSEISSQVSRLKSLHSSFPIIGIHSFTPSFLGQKRPYKFSILWKHETPFVDAVIKYLQSHPMANEIGFNQPYSAKEISAYTTEYHADKNHLPNLIFEVRQDLLESREDIIHWGKFIQTAILSAQGTIKK